MKAPDMHMLQKISKRDFSILIGNTLDHFDTALYGFLAPLLAPIFFPAAEPIVSLILAYSIVATGVITRPIGTYIFGILAGIHGPLVSLSYSLIGVAVTTVMIGLVPSYELAGPIAPVILIIVRSVRGIFAAGESTIAKLFILEDKTTSQALESSYLYQTSAIAGILLASLASTIVIYFEIKQGWRICFWLGGITAFSGYFLRRYKSDESSTAKVKLLNSYGIGGVMILFNHKSNIIRIALVNSFSHITYAIPFVVMNSVIPMITDIDLKTMMSFNTILLVFDMLLIPLVGRKLTSYAPNKIMFYSALSLAITILPLWYFTYHASLFYICCVRIWIVFWGVVFLCPLNLWCSSLIEGRDKYIVVGIANAIGASTIGKMTPAICLSLYYYTGSYVSIGWYVIAIISLTLIGLITSKS
jgi:MFS family permease